MKDYYYILGINKEATLPEVQQAYKKLALKFHPDNNGGDPFFVYHYEKILEAYQVLSDDHKRFRYDKALDKDISEEVDLILDGPAPVVASFFASKKAGKKGDLLTISWEVLNAEVVHINLIGEVSSNGTQTIRLVEENESEEFLTITLSASNSHSSKKSDKELKIKNLDYAEEFSSAPQRQNVFTPQPNKKNNSVLSKLTQKPNKKKQKNVEEDDEDDDDDELVEIKPIPKKKKKEVATIRQQQSGSAVAYVLVLVMIFIIILLLYSMHQINPMF